MDVELVELFRLAVVVLWLSGTWPRSGTLQAN